MGYYNLFPQFPHLHPHVIYHLVFVPALLVIFDLVSNYPNNFFFIWSQANLICNYSQKLQGILHQFLSKYLKAKHQVRYDLTIKTIYRLSEWIWIHVNCWHAWIFGNETKSKETSLIACGGPIKMNSQCFCRNQV